ncbi:hypothetical protein CWE14_05475 [Aliidiomarina soli]|uniref:Lipoprotein n=2 Tax=Aliidiomarina soli TaxID=1928574 RepID=A0A432WJ99_9GAMM|nr:hypothetical protein CWE14_05475 [Aliidiomarina soli]
MPLRSKPMTHLKTVVLALVVALTLSACASSAPPDEYAYFNSPNMRSVLVLPPANRTTAAQAPDLFYTSLAVPLTRAGFYVFPSQLTQQLLRDQGIIDGAQLESVDPRRFYELFGADMVLQTTLVAWDTSYLVIGGSVTVAAQYQLVSTHTGEVVWQANERQSVNTGGDSSSLLGALLETALNTAQQDYIPLAREMNRRAFSSLPHGPYHPRFISAAERAEILRSAQDDAR